MMVQRIRRETESVSFLQHVINDNIKHERNIKEKKNREKIENMVSGGNVPLDGEGYPTDGNFSGRV